MIMLVRQLNDTNISQNRFIQVSTGNDNLLQIDGYTWKGTVYWDYVGEYQIIYTHISDGRQIEQIVHIIDSQDQGMTDEYYYSKLNTDLPLFKTLDYTNQVDNNIIYIGTSHGNDLVFLKKDENNEIILEKTYPFEADVSIRDVLLDQQNNIVIVGQIRDQDTHLYHGFLFVINQLGTVMTYQIFDDNISSYFNAVDEYNGDYIMVGGIKTNQVDVLNGWFLHVDKTGVIKSQQDYGGNSLDRLDDISIDGDMIFVVGNTMSTTGDFQSYTKNIFDGIILQLNANGEIKNTKYISGSLSDYINSCDAIDGTLVIGGQTKSNDGFFVDTDTANSAFISTMNYNLISSETTYFNDQPNQKVVDVVHNGDLNYILLRSETVQTDLTVYQYQMIVLDQQYKQTSLINIFNQDNTLLKDMRLLKGTNGVYVKGLSQQYEVGDGRVYYLTETPFLAQINHLMYDSTQYGGNSLTLFINDNQCEFDISYIGDTYNPDMYGNYEANIRYVSNALDIESKIDITNELDVNIEENQEIKSNTNLYFNGVGYLDGTPVQSGYTLTSSGDHILELYGANQEMKTIHFTISDASNETITEVNRESWVGLKYIDIGIGSLVIIALSAIIIYRLKRS